ncbi:hypothetical protein KY290_023689 [Solanum tuberosum]|uniref:Uncharacterized protein n=1 Tax=Solanum tuberosum TaxID=4113 RepID=A0ABQ7V807_SOLTU|nr:hypothetical protein KY290_023689 [Solanum tuberosum]
MKSPLHHYYNSSLKFTLYHNWFVCIYCYINDTTPVATSVDWSWEAEFSVVFGAKAVKDEWKKVRMLTWAEADRAAIDDDTVSRANGFGLTLFKLLDITITVTKTYNLRRKNIPFYHLPHPPSSLCH